MFRSNTAAWTKATEKMNQGELKLEEILDDEDFVADVKTNPNSQFAPFFTTEIIKKLIDYATKMPESDDHKIGHKFPFNACEILCSENNFIIDKLMEFVRMDNEDSEINGEGVRKDSNISHEGLEEESEDSSERERREEEEKEQKEKAKETEGEENKKNNNVINNKSDEVEETKESNAQNNNLEKENEQGEKTNVNSNSNEGKKSRHKKTPGGTQEILDEEVDLFNISQDNNELSNIENSDIVYDNSNVIYTILDYFLSFLQAEEELNFVLAGYFCKIFNNLISQRNFVVLKYLLKQKFDIVVQLIKNINRKSISECLIRILISNTDDMKDDTAAKVEIIDKILEEALNGKDEDENYEKMENISNLFLECLSNKRFYCIFMTNIKLLQKVNTVISNNMKNEIMSKELIKILIKINENILKDFSSPVTPIFSQQDSSQYIFNFNNIDDDINNADNGYNSKHEKFDLQAHLSAVIDILSESINFVVTDFVSSDEGIKFNTTFEKEKKIMGGKKLLEFEYMKTIIDILINGFANELFIDKILYNFDIIIRSNLFKVAIDFFFYFEMNNLYQKLFEQMMILICNKHSPEILTKHIFLPSEENNHQTLIYSPCDFLSVLINRCVSKESMKFEYNSGNSINSGFLAVLCEVAHIVYISENTEIANIVSNHDKFEKFYTTFIENIRERFNKGLLYNINPKVTNLDRLSMGEYEFTSEEKSKDFENQPPGISLNEIIQTGLDNFLNGNYKKKAVVSSTSNIDNINPLDLVNNPPEEEEGMNCFEARQAMNEAFSEEKNRVDLELTNNNELIFEVRRPNMNEVDVHNVDNAVRNSSGFEGLNTAADANIDFSNQLSYYDNIYWKANFPNEEDILKDL